MLSLSRLQGTVLPPAWILRPTRLAMGPVGPCSPGIHSGYMSVMAPGLAGMDICTWKRRRAASVASTFSLTGVCACSGKETSERRATAEIRIPSILSTRGRGPDRGSGFGCLTVLGELGGATQHTQIGRAHV